MIDMKTASAKFASVSWRFELNVESLVLIFCRIKRIAQLKTTR